MAFLAPLMDASTLVAPLMGASHHLSFMGASVAPPVMDANPPVAEMEQLNVIS